ncbi:SDR family oxidoreductase [Herbidospora sp. NBRC 101105]|uniref:SDR family NAD(P)-dependent oxidoreductase n=1 Tax=Herbidospora sp. NBRC 101105 TaxID=3032195 RepID=UPI002554344F|nr:SDR family oxidoreductase [Herbidospora sp. NBRC 101105]
MTSVLIAGGASGIGAATAARLRAAGADVHVADIDAAGAAEVVKALDAHPGSGTASHVDLATADGPAQAVADAVEAHGRLDAIVFCAGLLVETELANFSASEWDRTMALNLRAPFFMTQAAAPHLAASAHGRVVLTGSTAAFRGGGGSFAYAASKGGLVALTRSLAVALGPGGVCVTCVCPGWIDTPFNDPYWTRVGGKDNTTVAALESRIPLGGQGVPDDVAAVVEFLVSPGSRYLTGQAVVVDGGLLAS